MAKGFGGFSGGGNMQALLQQTQKMQRDMQKAQEEAEGFLAEGSAGGGSVITVSIRPEAVDPSDVEMLQDLVRQAANDALNKVRENTNERLAKVTAGFNIPGLL
jgi:DNA-binding YbaB/EbfC family protein